MSQPNLRPPSRTQERSHIVRTCASQVFRSSMRLTLYAACRQALFAVGAQDIQVISESSTRALSRHHKDSGGHRSYRTTAMPQMCAPPRQTEKGSHSQKYLASSECTPFYPGVSINRHLDHTKKLKGTRSTGLHDEQTHVEKKLKKRTNST